ncbi:substrate-binding domain-containing protein [candidate division KSB1 bacterium]|nr:substrate-binding domain-containing protein [candidate division KSB1 bacterium]
MIIDRNSPVPQYFQLQTWLIEQIEQGVFKTNDKIPTEEELAEITGLARATIRQAVQNLVNMGYLERKRRLGTFVINNEAKSETRTIVGLLVPDIRSGYAPELARGVEDEAAKNKHSLILCDTDDLYVKTEFHVNRLLENSVAGVILMPPAATDEQNQKIVTRFLNNNIPVVLVDRIIPGIEIDYVTTNNFEGGYEITEYLIKKGHRKIGIVLSTLFSTERDRLEGYKKALTDHGIPIDPDIIIADSGPFIQNRYFKYARTLLKKRNDLSAIFAGHDRIALIFYSLAKEMGVSIPGDISIVGYDDLHFTTIPLTTMHQPIYEMGQESMKLIMSRINGEDKGPRDIVLKSHIVERESVDSLV